MGHEAISNDKSPFAPTVARAKLAPPSLTETRTALDRWWRDVESVRELDFSAEEFGLNGAVKDYYHPKSLEEVLRARAIFLKKPPRSNAEAFIWASLLHVLHGDRPYALSRTSHPISPFVQKAQLSTKMFMRRYSNGWRRHSSALYLKTSCEGLGYKVTFDLWLRTSSAFSMPSSRRRRS
jgi:hypothetical protein